MQIRIGQEKEISILNAKHDTPRKMQLLVSIASSFTCQMADGYLYIIIRFNLSWKPYTLHIFWITPRMIKW